MFFKNKKVQLAKFEDFYRICVNAVKTIGINLMPDEDWSTTYPELTAQFFRYYNIFWYINGAFLLASLSGILIAFMDDLASVEFLKSLTGILTGISNYYKGYLMSQYQEKIREILKSLKKLFLTSEEDQKHFKVDKTLRNLLRMKRIYLTLYTTMLLGVFIPELIIFATTGKHSQLNWTPFEINTTFRFFANLIWLAWIAFAFCLNGFGADFILFSTITLLSIQFKVNMNFKIF
jgi:hypothetical protein